MADIELFEKFDGRPVVAIGFGAVHVGAIESVDGQQRPFETVAHVGNVRQPTQIRRDRVQCHEESREQQNWNCGYRTKKNGGLLNERIG